MLAGVRSHPAAEQKSSFFALAGSHFALFCGRGLCNRSPPPPPSKRMAFFCERSQRNWADIIPLPEGGIQAPWGGGDGGERVIHCSWLQFGLLLSLCPGCQGVTACGQRAKLWKEECVRPSAFSCFIKLQRIARYSASVRAGQENGNADLTPDMPADCWPHALRRARAALYGSTTFVQQHAGQKEENMLWCNDEDIFLFSGQPLRLVGSVERWKECSPLAACCVEDGNTER